MNYLVTGGAGFIGSHLCELLVENHHQVIIIDDLSTGVKSNIQHLERVHLIPNKVQDFHIQDLPKIDGIFHLAAQASVPVSIDEFYYSSSNNLLSSIQVFEWAKKLSVPIVYASSSAVYGNLAIGDDTIEKYDILSPYAQDKLTMEHYAHMAWTVYQTKSIGLRFFNVYGPKQDPSNPYSGVISIFIDRLLKGLPVTVNGGYQTRDFVYVTDIINCLATAMNKLHKRAFCETFNVGTGVSISVDELLRLLMRRFKTDPEIIRVKLPKGDPEKSEGTYKKLEKLLNVNIKQFNNFEQGLKKTVNYFLKL